MSRRHGNRRVCISGGPNRHSFQSPSGLRITQEQMLDILREVGWDAVHGCTKSDSVIVTPDSAPRPSDTQLKKASAGAVGVKWSEWLQSLPSNDRQEIESALGRFDSSSPSPSSPPPPPSYGGDVSSPVNIPSPSPVEYDYYGYDEAETSQPSEQEQQQEEQEEEHDLTPEVIADLLVDYFRRPRARNQVVLSIKRSPSLQTAWQQIASELLK